MSKDLDSRKVGEVLVVSDNVHQKMQVLQVVSPNLECLKDYKKFFIMNIIVKFQSRKGVEVECNRIDIIICRIDRKDSTKYIIRSLSLNNNLSI